MKKPSIEGFYYFLIWGLGGEGGFCGIAPPPRIFVVAGGLGGGGILLNDDIATH